jgi:hypothetical protein
MRNPGSALDTITGIMPDMGVAANAGVPPIDSAGLLLSVVLSGSFGVLSGFPS